MAINRSYLIAGVAVLAIACWFGFNSAGNERDINADLTERAQTSATTAPTVVVRRVTAEPHTIRLAAYGRTEPNRMVEVKAKTPASVTATPVAEGTRVSRGDVICRQDVDARQANVDQAKAQLAKAEADLTATTVLVDKGYKSSTSLGTDRAAVDSARAMLKSAEIELGNIVLRAPFDGIFEKRLAEVGDYLAPGQPCGMVVELSPLKVEAELSETQVGRVERGQEVEVKLATGETVLGRIATIESIANPATRTFRMETRLPNADNSLRAGVSATLSFDVGEAMASRIPANVLTLDDNGRTGVRYVDSDSRVRFAATTQVDEVDSAIWVTGLPETARVIIDGQDFVSVGTQVEQTYEGERARSGAAPGLTARISGQ